MFRILFYYLIFVNQLFTRKCKQNANLSGICYFAWLLYKSWTRPCYREKCLSRSTMSKIRFAWCLRLHLSWNWWGRWRAVATNTIYKFVCKLSTHCLHPTKWTAWCFTYHAIVQKADVKYESINGRVVYLAPVRIQSKLTRLCRTEFEILNIQSARTVTTKRQQLTTGRPPVHANCLRTCEFALRGSDSFGSSEPNACNKWPVYQHAPSFVNTE